MNRLQTELHRLFVPRASAAEGEVRTAVLDLSRPADWTALSRVWRGVQSDLALPAPAIAVNGIDGFQLWFSLSEPVLASQALGFLDALRTRYLSDVASPRLAMTAAVGAMPPQPTLAGQWSAFVAADLAPVFADEPWLDIPPSPEGQAEVLCRLESIKCADFLAAVDRLGLAPTPIIAQPVSTDLGSPGAGLDPEIFLRQVMNDDRVTLGLRIEAAKALLHTSGASFRSSIQSPSEPGRSADTPRHRLLD